MITRIDSISGLGQFNGFKWDKRINDFSKFNIFYGWNGSGKSTLSRAIELFSRSAARDGTPQVEATTDSGIAHGPSSSPLTHLYIFNCDFISENIDWNNKAKSILFVSKEKIAERDRLNEVDQQISSLHEQCVTLDSKITEGKDSHDKFLSVQASTIKKRFQQISTDDRTYFNYNKNSLSTFLESKSPSQLDGEQISELRKTAIATSIDPISTFAAQSSHAARSLIDRVNAVRSQTVTAQVIDKLKGNPALNKWVQDGLSLHKGLDTCEFCGSRVESARLTTLNAHFNDQYDAFTKELSELQLQVESLSISPETVVQNKVFEAFHIEYQQGIDAVKKSLSAIKTIQDNIRQSIDEKYRNPFSSLTASFIDTDTPFSLINKNIDNLNSVAAKHNEMSRDLKSKQLEARAQLEAAFVFDATAQYDYIGSLKKISNDEISLNSLRQQIKPLSDERSKIASSLFSESIAASEFNAALSHFLGHREIEMNFNENEGGYQIKRTRDGSIARSLSEGEKNAIALIYFSVKTKENNNQVEKTIIVIDDPVSSLDSHFTFHAYAFIKEHFEKCKQMFIMSHNFSFFKLMHDWLSGKNKKNEPPKSQFYTVLAEGNGMQRASRFENSEESLLGYASEYHYAMGR